MQKRKMQITIEKARGIAKDTVNLLKDGVKNSIESAKTYDSNNKRGQAAYER